MIPKGHQRQSRHGEMWPLNENAKQKPQGSCESLFKLGQGQEEKMHSVAFGFSCQRNRECRAQCNLQMEIP